MSEPSGYYLVRRREISEAFLGVAEGASQFWASEFGQEQACAMVREAVATFDGLLPHLPDVGGDRNWLAHLLPVAAWYVALYSPMKARGKTAEDVGRLVYDLNEMKLQCAQKEEALRQGEEMFTRESLERMRAWASWTQERELPANWVAEFVPGDGQDFDFGYDYSECAILKYLTGQGVAELAPYICVCDFQDSAAKGSGLRRTRSLTYGDSLCDFRYKRGGPIPQDWSTEIAVIRSRARG
jgi:hypothetical protein